MLKICNCLCNLYFVKINAEHKFLVHFYEYNHGNWNACLQLKLNIRKFLLIEFEKKTRDMDQIEEIFWKNEWLLTYKNITMITENNFDVTRTWLKHNLNMVFSLYQIRNMTVVINLFEILILSFDYRLSILNFPQSSVFLLFYFFLTLLKIIHIQTKSQVWGLSFC